MQVAGRFYIVYPRKNDEVPHLVSTDWHQDERNFAASVLDRDLDRIDNDPLGTTIIGGDWASFILPSDSRYDPAMWPDGMSARDTGDVGESNKLLFATRVTPRRERIIGLGIGNHYLTWVRRNNRDQYHPALCKELGIASLGYSAYFDIHYVHVPGSKRYLGKVLRKPPTGGRSSFRVRYFRHHGTGAARTEGSKVNKLVQAIADYGLKADVVILEHMHSAHVIRKPRLYADQTSRTLRAAECLGITTGAYLRAYGEGDQVSYTEQGMFAPSALGGTFLRVIPSERYAYVETGVRL